MPLLQLPPVFNVVFVEPARGNLCELGTIAVQHGAIQCDLCRIGEYANRTGMSSCYRCPPVKPMLRGFGERGRWVEVDGMNSLTPWSVARCGLMWNI